MTALTPDLNKFLRLAQNFAAQYGLEFLISLPQFSKDFRLCTRPYKCYVESGVACAYNPNIKKQEQDGLGTRQPEVHETLSQSKRTHIVGQPTPSCWILRGSQLSFSLWVCVCRHVYVCVCVCMHMRLCMCVHPHVLLYECVCVHTCDSGEHGGQRLMIDVGCLL